MSNLDNEEIEATKELKIKTTFICFSDRKKIEKMFIKYCEENYIPKSLFNLITFLQTKDLLNRDKIKEKIAELKKLQNESNSNVYGYGIFFKTIIGGINGKNTNSL